MQNILADAKFVAHKPKSISMREAAALPLVGITAYEGLIRAGIQPSQNVLVHMTVRQDEKSSVKL